MNQNKNVVYIVGGDHHNGLGLARIFGLNHVRVKSVVIDDQGRNILGKSKYIEESKVVPTAKEAYDYLSKKPSEENKPFIVPYSDAAAIELDSRLNEFKDRYYVPSINGKQNCIAKLMDKQNQYLFAISEGIKMAYTITIRIQEDHPELDTLPFPCIIKPVISAEGEKRDITICNDRLELDAAIEKYKALGYYRALVQEYLNIDYEIDVFGCILNQPPYICQVPTKTIRSWLPNRGTNSFSQIITRQDIVEECKKIISSLRNLGFYGLYDIELFVVDGKIFLNEINLRNSGDVYMGIHQKYYYPYAWYCDVLGRKVEILSHPERGDYVMTECADIRHVLIHKIKLSEWIKDYFKCKDYAVVFKGDMKPVYAWYFYYIKQFFKGKRL